MKSRTNTGTGVWDWTEIDWKVINKQVLKLQRRIFRATKEAQLKGSGWDKVKNLMKLIINSKSALALAIQTVTVKNKGRNTPGIDGYVAIKTKEKNRLMKNWNWNEVSPTKRVYIPKSNGKKRPLGIPTIKDRIGQAIIKMAYEPVFEVSFEPNSYGFRPGRSCHDAIQEVFAGLKKGSSHHWVLDADIKGAFDNISHGFIMDKLEGLPKRSLIKKWLKCGYVDNRIFHPTNSGTPQGGIISPLLANIALDGLQEVISEKCKIDYTTRSRGKTINKKKEVDKYRFARYADDFVITSQTKENLEEIIPRVEKWLRKRGLELNREKTKIRNIIEEGFSFLGFQIQQRKTKTLRLDSKRYKKKARKMLKNLKPNAIRIPTPNAKIREEICYSCIITPDKEEVKRFLKEIRSILKNEARALNTEDVIKKLNPKIRGWLNYYRFVCSKKTFNNVRYKILSSIYRYLKRQHPKKAWKWIKRKYFKTIDKDTLNFFTISSGKRKKEEILVNAAKDVPIIRFEKVKGNSSPFDPDLKEYWKKRKTKWGKSKFAKGSKYEKVYIHQKGICPICNLPIELDDNFEVHHTIPIKRGGNSETKNLQILHSHCHKAKHKKLHQDT